MRYPTIDFDHLDRQYRVGDAVADDDEMVLARPDLFAAKKARTTSTTTTTDTSTSEDDD